MEETQPKCFVFVLTPFADEFRDLYEVGIKPACREAGAYCERVDESFFDEGILERVYNQISKADVIVGLMTGRNPNVYYEVGYAHALGKRVILLTSAADDIPFDLKYYPCVVYGNRIVELKSQLQKRIEWCIANPKGSLARVEMQVRMFADGAELVPGSILERKRRPNAREVRTEFALHNPTTLLYPKGSFQIGIVTPQGFNRCTSTKAEEGVPALTGQMRDNRWVQTAVPTVYYPEAACFPLSDGKNLHLLNWWSEVLFPSGWARAVCDLESKKQLEIGALHDVAIRLFTEFGAREFPFRIRVA